MLQAPRREAEPGAGRQSDGHRGARVRKERREGLGVQEWSDGSKYEGEFVNGFKHGTGRYSWRNGEYYEGSFYKDYRHGDGVYCWPAGHKFIGKFYLNRKEGYGQQLFPDGATFQGLYHADQRFGPGVASYPDKCQDVGLWLGNRLLKLCTSADEGFSLKNVPEYATYMDPAVATHSLSQPLIICGGLHTKARTSSEAETYRHLLSDEDFILPPGMESYSTDSDHLPLPPGRRTELDQHFFGELWEPDTQPYRGYDRDPLSTLPLQTRMLAHIHKHRLQAENLDWDIAAVLSLNRDGFGPKGPLEVSSELLLQQASRGGLQVVSQLLQMGFVHPDVADSQGHTALIAASVNCHNNVIQLLLDMGADIDKLNCEGMSALAVCHVLYYPLQSLHATSAKLPDKVLKSRSPCVYSPQISPLDFTTHTLWPNNRAQTNQSSQSHLSKASEELTEPRVILHYSSKVSNGSELTTDGCTSPGEPETPADAKHLWEKDREETVREGGERDSTDTERVDVEFGEKRETESVKKNVEISKEEEEDVEEREDGGSQWREPATAGGRRGKDKGLTAKQTFDSAHSINSYNVQVTEEVMQRSAEALSHTGITQQTGIKMAAIKTGHCVRLSTLKLLLVRGADPNVSRVPMPVLFLAIMAADTEAVRRLLLCGARTDIPLPPERKGLYPLHVAAVLQGPAAPRITELLLHAAADPDTQASDQDEIYEQDKNASRVVALLLSHRASTDHLWSGHSPLSLAIASGNDLVSLVALAVEELLRGGADPNMPLGVGSALCVLANINYHLGGRAKLLDMLAKAGANILMAVRVGDVVGTAVDYAYYSFNQDSRIASTPFHALNMHERETFKARHQLLSMMGDLLRQAAGQREREQLEKERHFVLNTSADGLQKTGVFKSQKFLRPLSVMLKSKTATRPLSDHRFPKPLSMAKKVLESQFNLKENYSSN
ncbi:hypothetical protein PAMP_023910 [Pampus punctatissimus]